MSSVNPVCARFASALIVALAALLVSDAGIAGMICASYEYHPNLTRAVQKALVDNGARGIVTDGKWGPKSRDALREFQRRKGLKVSGEVDEPTFRALLGPDVPYEGVTVRRNPMNAPADVYRKECPEAGP
jgi:Putative peptidoglycan binding domain